MPDAPGLAPRFPQFGVAFDDVEAAVVVYPRTRYKTIHQRLHPDRAPGDLLPIIRRDQLEAEGPVVMYQRRAELVREAATFATLAAVALAVARHVPQRFAAFLIALGVGGAIAPMPLIMRPFWPAPHSLVQ